ncbi:GntR family transcriptional regulator [Novosphingobium sp. 1949]|uniref:GntR family transcriptional regulator n=1 Tax=Novosphingobium organovorum TaxID=2930092 RepID=A0ABT0BEF7_9SPHN|nr:GntR family transcriptional regulator [Novosphingobium organovorum]MCJ2183456.1 GntR family transcriptional regulator [Novosphingobium organovorum]
MDLIGELSGDEAGPRYLRLQRLIRKAIEGRRLPPGAALPSERDLCDQYGLSRVTIRKAIDGLVGDGILERRQGAGTFVRADKADLAEAGRVEKSITALSSFSEDMAARGRRSESRWIEKVEATVSTDEAMTLGLSPGSRVFHLQRIRYGDGETMAIERAVVAGWALRSIEDVGDSLYAALDTMGNRPVRALQRVRAISFGQEHADLLGVKVGDPCLLIERRAFLADGRIVEVTYSYYRGDAYDLVAELSETRLD